ncbi:hypothetical protein HMPREF1218_0252 [Hoylesella pleuritidis F0068]|uniref:Uncharacterized protein n=1 Tax=Hoylesella pleuritidis F0068 TaxID=1081904 RepID=U2LGQ8_9BACT|nr:hypothetical protein HMPREF1218_0252 [Hoylesella pleuritidis F0068]
MNRASERQIPGCSILLHPGISDIQDLVRTSKVCRCDPRTRRNRFHLHKKRCACTPRVGYFKGALVGYHRTPLVGCVYRSLVGCNIIPFTNNYNSSNSRYFNLSKTVADTKRSATVLS